MKEHILIFGDICPDNNYRTLFDSINSIGFSSELLKKVTESDLVVANLECPATNNTVPITKCGPNLRAKPEDIDLLRNCGFDVLSLANNHVLDYGCQGLIDTISMCQFTGIKTVGAGTNKVEASKPIICSVGEKEVGIISFAESEFNLAGDTTAGANGLDPYYSFEIIKELNEKCDYVIVLYHGGIEYYKYPSPLLQKKCRKIVESGANLVLCQHSHCIGTFENYSNGTIVYGQGNSFFGYRDNDNSWNEGLVIEIELSDSPKIEWHLMKATKYGIELANADFQERRIQQFVDDSANLSDPNWIKNEWINYANKQAALYMPLLYGWNRVFTKLNRLTNNKLFRHRYSRKARMTTMNLIRCEAHHEVIKAILEDEIFFCK